MKSNSLYDCERKLHYCECSSIQEAMVIQKTHIQLVWMAVSYQIKPHKRNKWTIRFLIFGGWFHHDSWLTHIPRLVAQMMFSLFFISNHHLISGYNNIFIRPFMCEFIRKVTLIVCAVWWWFALLLSFHLFSSPSRWPLVTCAYVCGRFAAWMQFTEAVS